MALLSNALFTNPDDVWDALCVPPEERTEKATLMDRWINGVSSFMEQLLNRKLVEVVRDEALDGNGRSIIYTKQTPASNLTSLRVYYSDFRNFDDIDVDQTPGPDREVEFNEKGRIVLLPDAPITYFYHGVGNVLVSYTAGMPEGDLEAIRIAVIEMIANRYEEIGRDPREQTRSDSIKTLSTFNKEDFDELPFYTQQIVWTYRRRQC